MTVGGGVWIQVDEHGVFLSRRSNRIVFKRGREVLKEVSLDKVEGVVVRAKVGFSSSLLSLLSQKGIPLIIDDSFTSFYFPSSVLALPSVRQAQVRLTNTKRKKFTYSVLMAKVWNQKEHMRLWGKVLEIVKSDDPLVMERSTARRYWALVKEIIPCFSFRDKFGEDIVNSSFNYAYGILKYKVLASVLRVGLDPYFGVFHSIKDYRISFVFDVMEVFRPLVDYVVLSFIRDKCDKEFEHEKYALAKEVVSLFKRQFVWGGERRSLEQIIVLQCKNIARFFTSKNAECKCFRWREREDVVDHLRYSRR